MSVKYLQIVSVPVTNQERSKAFYVETLGFELRREAPMGPDQRWIEVAPKGAQTSVTLVTWFETMPPGCVKGLVLATDNIQSAYDELSARGVTFAGPIQQEFWGTFAEFDDPDGNGWVLIEDPGEASA